jgi:hypothetical protein
METSVVAFAAGRVATSAGSFKIGHLHCSRIRGVRQALVQLQLALVDSLTDLRTDPDVLVGRRPYSSQFKALIMAFSQTAIVEPAPAALPQATMS